MRENISSIIPVVIYVIQEYKESETTTVSPPALRVGSRTRGARMHLQAKHWHRSVCETRESGRRS